MSYATRPKKAQPNGKCKCISLTQNASGILFVDILATCFELNNISHEKCVWAIYLIDPTISFFSKNLSGVNHTHQPKHIQNSLYIYILNIKWGQ